MGYDASAVGVALRKGTRDPIVIESDIASMIVDRHFPVPREHGVMKHMADLAMFGDAATIDTARGASLVQPPVAAVA